MLFSLKDFKLKFFFLQFNSHSSQSQYNLKVKYRLGRILSRTRLGYQSAILAVFWVVRDKTYVI